ncbi:hypothetical protein [Glutamicibacter sp. AOP5-A2-18]|uniref:hypothetical protein n=1 Tax=Glutamicibacter sp. AOP5-A2-18 TaxID=3457656 RepID=UPI00403408B3
MFSIRTPHVSDRMQANVLDTESHIALFLGFLCSVNYQFNFVPVPDPAIDLRCRQPRYCPFDPMVSFESGKSRKVENNFSALHGSARLALQTAGEYGTRHRKQTKRSGISCQWVGHCKRAAKVRRTRPEAGKSQETGLPQITNRPFPGFFGF